MDARWWFVSDWQREGLIKVKFVKTKDNVTDIGTKNVTIETLARHVPRLLAEKEGTKTKTDSTKTKQLSAIDLQAREGVELENYTEYAFGQQPDESNESSHDACTNR